VLLAILPLIHFFAAFLLAAGLNWARLIPWRKTEGQPWTERARILFPARRAAALAVFLVPAICTGVEAALLPETGWVVLRAGLPALLGAILGTYFFDIEVFPNYPFRTWLHSVSAVWILQMVRVAIFVGAMGAMPYQLDWRAAAIVLGVIAIQSWLVWGGALRLARWARLIVPAPERLLAIVATVAAKLGVPPPPTWLMRGIVCNAVAMPHTRTLVFTERLLAITPDDEVAAVCAHEFGHLLESPRALLVRFLSSVSLVPMLFVRPAIHHFGPSGFFGICALSLLGSRLFRTFARRMEHAADSVALAHQGEAPGTYARALARIYEANQIPAVMPGKRQIHPHLYDRLVTAGVTPDFPRPAPAKNFSWLGALTFATALFVFICATFVRSELREQTSLADFADEIEEPAADETNGAALKNE
jgi:Zn-dependent protease with chaperone function